MLTTNSVKAKLKNNIPVMGTWNTLASPLLTEVFAQGGLDFQIIDLEHGPFILDQIHLHVSACEGTNTCTPLVRVPTNADWMILQALDQGAHGVVVPHINCKENAVELLNSAKYHPKVKRGFTPFSKAGGFTNKNTSQHVITSNEETLTIIIIESREGLDNLDEIVELEGIDVIYFGAYDLSQVLGHPGNIRHPEVISTIQKGVDLVTKYGKSAGGFVPQSKDDIQWLLDIGMRFITYEVDSSIILSHVHELKNWFSNEIKK